MSDVIDDEQNSATDDTEKIRINPRHPCPLFVQFADALREGDVNVISTRRFLRWPATVVFGATGFEVPIPFA